MNGKGWGWVDWARFGVEQIQNRHPTTPIKKMDANAKAGKHHIKKDPNDMSENGVLMMDILERNKLVLGNSLNCCKGVITRQRKTESKDQEERSVIDYFIMCEDMKNFVDEIIIDESKNIHCLDV